LRFSFGAMLFHSSIRKELARSFGATLVVLVTVIMTMTLIRTVGEASRGTFNPTDVLIIMGYTVLSDLPTILSLSLFIAILSVVTRMYKDSEMVIWFGSGSGLMALIRPMFRFSWPILVVILVLALFVLPWSSGRIEDLRDKFEKRGDIARIEPGQFQESANGDRVFFVEGNSQGKQTGTNVFIATKERGKETVTSARTGRISIIGPDKYLILQSGQRLEKDTVKSGMNLSAFETYGVRVGVDDASSRSYIPVESIPTLGLLEHPVIENLGELSWRIGLVLAGINFVLLGIASAGMNPRVGRVANLGFAFLLFVVYFNMLLLGKTWVASGRYPFLPFLLVLHGGAAAVTLLWLLKRHNNWEIRWPPRRPVPGPASSAPGPGGLA
jgi:lipopolysaccharide export system permease protein